MGEYGFHKPEYDSLRMFYNWVQVGVDVLCVDVTECNWM